VNEIKYSLWDYVIELATFYMDIQSEAIACKLIVIVWMVSY